MGERRILRFGVRPVLLAGLAAVLAMVLISFGRMMWTGYQLTQRAEEMRGQIARLEGENQQSQAELEYLLTDEAAEELARKKLGWARPGDTVLIVSSAGLEPVVVATLAPVARPTSPNPVWQRWWQVLFGQPDADAP